MNSKVILVASRTSGYASRHSGVRDYARPARGRGVTVGVIDLVRSRCRLRQSG